MLVRASVHTHGLVPGQSGEVDGRLPSVRAAITAGYLERVSEVEEDGPAPFTVTQTDEDPEPAEQDATEGEPDQDD